MFRKYLLFAVMILSGCSQTTEFLRPATPVPEIWPGVDGSDGLGTVVSTKTEWHDFFTDPRLQVLIAAALEYNRDLRIAAARVQEARAQYGIARADLRPTVNLLGSSDTTHSPADVVTGGAPLTSQRLDFSLSSVSFELDFWGRLSGLSEAARQSYLATEESRRAVYLSLISDVASAYFSVLQARELHALSLSTVEANERTVALIAKGRDLGGVGDYEFEQARGVLESSRSSLDEVEHQQTVATNKLNFLIGNSPVKWGPGATLEQQVADDDLAPGLPSEVLLARPDVMAAEQRLRAAHANIGAARAAFLPKVVLTTAVGLASSGLAGLLAGGAWSFQPLISMPLFDGGRTAAGVDIAQARKVVAVAEYEKTIQQAFREVADLLSSRASLAKQMRAAQANMKAQDTRLRIVQGRFEAGFVSYLEVLAARRDLVVAQQTGVQVRRARLEATAQLYKALGGGDPKA